MDPPPKPDVEEEDEEFVDSSSDSVLSEEWQDLSKSDYAKVIFCNLYHDLQNGEVGCKFQITDNVHEDPCDYVGLFKVGEGQCLVSKMLSETECEEDGKLLRCVFAYEDLPSDLQDGFYQFQYITRDQEICGASTPFEIKQAQGKEDSSDDDIVTENAENDFVLVQHILEKKNRMLEQLLEKFRAKNLALSTDMEVLLETKSKLCQEKEEVIENLHKEILFLKSDLTKQQMLTSQKEMVIENLSTQVKQQELDAVNTGKEYDSIARALSNCQSEKSQLHKEVQILKQMLKEKETLPTEPEQRILLEQLDDQKFMIRALEDSKQLALKEMSDLSESLSKRTKVLNQTRCELATCKGKVKEMESINDQQNKELYGLRDQANEMLLLVEANEEKYRALTEELARLRDEGQRYLKLAEEKEDQLKRLSGQNADLAEAAAAATPVVEDKSWRDFVAETDVKVLLRNAFTEAEVYLALVDKIVEKIDFSDAFQEKAFYELKILFFVLLGKMKKPNELSDPQVNSLQKSQCKKEKRKKKASRTLPSCQGHTSTQNPSTEDKTFNAAELQKDLVATHNKEVQVSEESSVSEASSSLTVNQEECEKKLKEMIVELNEEMAKKNAIIEYISSEKTNLLKSELASQEIVREHAARIAEAAELYKKQFVEIEKLKKKLRHVQRHSSKAGSSKVIGYESSSTAEDVSPLKVFEKAPPTKRPRKTSTKAAEKTVSPKMAERQPQMLKVLLKSYNKKAEKVASLKTKKAPKTHILEAAQASTSAVEEKAETSQAKCTNVGGLDIQIVPDVVWAASRLFSPLHETEMVKEGASVELNKNISPNTGKLAPLRSISDSDTGEHVLRNSTIPSSEGAAVENADVAISSPVKVAIEEDTCEPDEDNKLTPPPQLVKVDVPDNRDLGTVQLLFNEEIARVKNTLLSSVNEEEESFDIPCVLCNMHFEVTSQSYVKLMDHLENEHQISMCPVCGQLFEATVPKKYLEFHVNKHFQAE